MTFEEELWRSLVMAWNGGFGRFSKAPARIQAGYFEWKGYECHVTHTGVNASFEIFGVGIIYSSLVDGDLPFSYHWREEPSPEQLMKLRLLL